MKRKLFTFFSAAILFLAFWFLCVDGAIFVESCPDCLYGKDIYQIRFFTFPIYHRKIDEHTSIIQRISTDIGAECKHPKLSHLHKWRFWGLLIPQELQSGIDWMSGGDEWYDDKASAIVKEMVQTNPSLRDEFAERVLKNHDWVYFKAFGQKVHALRDGKSVPTPQR